VSFGEGKRHRFIRGSPGEMGQPARGSRQFRNSSPRRPRLNGRRPRASFCALAATQANTSTPGSYAIRPSTGWFLIRRRNGETRGRLIRVSRGLGSRFYARSRSKGAAAYARRSIEGRWGRRCDGKYCRRFEKNQFRGLRKFVNSVPVCHGCGPRCSGKPHYFSYCARGSKISGCD